MSFNNNYGENVNISNSDVEKYANYFDGSKSYAESAISYEKIEKYKINQTLHEIIYDLQKIIKIVESINDKLVDKSTVVSEEQDALSEIQFMTQMLKNQMEIPETTIGKLTVQDIKKAKDLFLNELSDLNEKNKNKTSDAEAYKNQYESAPFDFVFNADKQKTVKDIEKSAYMDNTDSAPQDTAKEEKDSLNRFQLMDIEE